ncbi:TauD/TfdA family dioxygenase [Streptomyces sp. NPDC055692]|uniref:TauD/TfdA family dioxygenase n=1 Tax=Streptomyces sp. NPDC055692 TaxID=3155683 RepID=UPI00342EEF67
MRISGTTCTELLDPCPRLQLGLRRTVLRVKDRRGRVRHLPASLPTRDGWRLRWDPRTCKPLSGVSIEEIERYPPSTRVDWQEGRLLLIDNFRMLHRRPEVSESGTRILERIYVWSE